MQNISNQALFDTETVPYLYERQKYKIDGLNPGSV